ncbi:MAG TPA: DUF5655 domain-containing protein [Hyphomicrobiaceae bacterium]|nr:DUF5655 domain-containing protein [Hyphomicrobiaceae bacterium]
MTADERQEEQQFLAELKARTGRDLAGWMAAIAAQNFSDKNETIDWLRGQGFAFARASWLERIHSNGGRPIYDGLPERSPRPAKARPAAPLPPRAVPKPPMPSPAAGDAALLAKLMAGAKGYRPLYVMLEEQVRASVPGLVLKPSATHISFGAPAEFAAVTLNASEVRLGLALGDRPFDTHVQRAKLKGPGPPITHMVVLTDARQVNADLLSLLLAANALING